jgi:hypothetical protein
MILLNKASGIDPAYKEAIAERAEMMKALFKVYDQEN